MRPLFHPAPADMTVEGILHALSDPVRCAIFLRITRQTCPSSCSEHLKIRDKPVPKSTLSHHFKALREAGLIRGERQGVEMLITPRCAEIEKRFPGLLRAILKAYTIQSGGKKPAPKKKLPSRRR